LLNNGNPLPSEGGAPRGESMPEGITHDSVEGRAPDAERVEQTILEPHAPLELEQFRVQGHCPEQVYRYPFSDGGALAVKARFAPGTLERDRKSFRWFRRDGNRWKSGLGGAHPPLYRLAELVAALKRGESVFVVEGEKCADALLERGIAATTGPHGSSKWDPAHSPVFEGADVALLPDNDAVGHGHMRDVAASLVGVAKAVRIVDLPGLLEGQDVVDWLAAGHGVDELLALAQNAPLQRHATEVADGWGEPLPLGCRSEAYPIPLKDGAPALVHDLVDEVAAAIKVDPAAPFGLVQIVLSAAAGNAFSIRVSHSHLEPNLARFVLWSAASGERKSATFRAVTSPLAEWVRINEPKAAAKRAEAKSREAILSSKAQAAEKKAAKASSPDLAEQHLSAAREAREAMPELPRRAIAFIGDITQPALVRHMAENGGAMAVMSADARQVVDDVLGQHRSDGSTDDSVYLRAHGGDRIDRARVGNTAGGEFVGIDRPSLAVGICVQPDKLVQLAKRPELRDSGFIARCNIIEPRSLVGERIETGLEQAVGARVAGDWNRVILALMDLRFSILDTAEDGGFEPLELILDPEAMELRRTFANEIEERQRVGGDLHGAGALASKAAGEAARLAGLWHLVQLTDEQRLGRGAIPPVPAGTWHQAEVAQRYHLAESLRVQALAQESKETKCARRLLAWVSRDPEARSVVAARDLISIHVAQDADGAEGLLRWLGERGWLRPVQAGQRKRAARWEVHPSVLGGAQQ
jgi:hypothetical protein